MRITALADRQGPLPPALDLQNYAAYREMAAAVSDEVGPVLRAQTFLGVGDIGGGSYSGHAELYDLDGIFRDMYGQPSMSPELSETLFGGGKGRQLAGTMLSTVGEAIERSVAALVGTSPHLPSARLLASYEDMVAMGRPAIDPASLGLFSEEQYRSPHFLYLPFTRQSRVLWVMGTRCVSGDEVWVPAQLVDMAHIYDPGEAIVGYPVSGGLSCHTSATAALYHGLTEVIERDAINVSWYTASPPRRVRLDSLPDEQVGAFVERLVLDHSSAALLLHDSGIVSAPTLSFVGFQDWLVRRQYCAGGGCDYVPAAALHKAFVEFGQTRSTLGLAVAAPGSGVGRNVEAMFDWDAQRPMSEMTLFFQAIGFYGIDENLPHLDGYLSGPEITWEEVLEHRTALGPESSVAERLEALLAEFTAAGIDPIALDYSHPDWRALSIQKVYVAELTTPFLQSRPVLGHPRLRDLRPEARLGTMALPLPYP